MNFENQQQIFQQEQENVFISYFDLIRSNSIMERSLKNNYNNLPELEELNEQMDIFSMPSAQFTLNQTIIDRISSPASEIKNEDCKSKTMQTCFALEKQDDVINFQKSLDLIGFEPNGQSSNNNNDFKNQFSLDFKQLLKQQKLKGKWKKNTNVPKFIARVFMEHFQNYALQQQQQLLAYHKRVVSQLKKRQSNNFTISDVLKLLGRDASLTNETKSRYQQLMQKIIRENMMQEIAGNKYIKNHQKSYIMAMKMYALRCRKRSLLDRVKIF